MIALDILGHDNFALALQFDLLKDLYKELPDIRVISNVREQENVNRSYRFDMKGDSYQVLEAKDWVPEKGRKFLLGAMSGKTMKTIYDYFSDIVSFDDFEFINICHPRAYVAKSAIINKGIILEPNVSISSQAILHDHIWVKRNSSIGHHTIVKSFTNVNPGVTIASCCEVGENCLIGVGATIMDKIKIGDNSVIGAGSVVTKDIPANVVAYGVPAKVIRDIH